VEYKYKLDMVVSVKNYLLVCVFIKASFLGLAQLCLVLPCRALFKYAVAK
jgi:hypothetical protein